jgi:hypothetical protein
MRCRVSGMGSLHWSCLFVWSAAGLDRQPSNLGLECCGWRPLQRRLLPAATNWSSFPPSLSLAADLAMFFFFVSLFSHFLPSKTSWSLALWEICNSSLRHLWIQNVKTQNSPRSYIVYNSPFIRYMPGIAECQAGCCHGNILFWRHSVRTPADHRRSSLKLLWFSSFLPVILSPPGLHLN